MSSMSPSARMEGATDVAAVPGRHPGMILTIIAACQLMLVLDTTIVNIALPRIQHTLHFSSVNLAWVLTAYTLAFGGLLLLGGRIGDIAGRRHVFMAGLLLFCVASLIGGLANSQWLLLTARAAQGVGAAMASPNALALITTNFTEDKERAKALGVWAAVSGVGGALGLIVGGMLTSWLSWRWVMFINVPIAFAVLVLAPRYIANTERHPGRFDIAGALTGTLGLTSVVYGLIHASSAGWGTKLTIGALIVGVVLIALFIVIEGRASRPIIPLGLFSNPDRVRAYVLMLFVVASMLGMFFFLTQFLQDVIGYSALTAGLAFLPLSAALILAAQRTSKLLPRLGSKRLMLPGAILTTGGMVWLTQISTSTSYASGILGPLLLFGVGVGLVYVPITVSAVSQVQSKDAGSASSMMNVMSQLGGTLGLAVLVTVFGTASRNAATHVPAGASPLVRAHYVLAHGLSSTFVVSAIFFGVVILVVLFTKQSQPRT